jgi:hypothetical protein
MPDQVRHDGWWMALLPLLLAACSPNSAPVTIDGSSPERFAATSAAAREQLTPADRLAFDQALASVGNRRHAADPDVLARTTFDGMTGAEIAEDYRRRTR